MIKVIADDKIPFLKGVLEPFVKVTYLPGDQICRGVLLKADALLIRTRTRCNAELLEETPVKFIGTATIGYDHIDTEYCKAHNIIWANAPGCNSSSVRQYVAAALLRIAKESGFNLKNKTLGIVGVGNVGKKVMQLAEITGMKVLLNDPPRERNEKSDDFVDLEHIVQNSDIITLHVPLNLSGRDKTLHLIDGEMLGKIRKGTWLINTSRGDVAETEALKRALSRERLSGVVLDVWEKEPELDIPLMHMSFLATPHIAGYSADGKANGTAMIVKAFCEFFNIPLKEWYPDNIPDPSEPLLNIDCYGKSNEEILRRSVSHTYNIVEDDIKLRIDPSRFEFERGSYPLRREFNAYTIRLKECNMEIRGMIEKLGFKVQG